MDTAKGRRVKHKNPTKITFAIPQYLRDKLKQYAKENGMKMQFVAAAAIEEKLEKES